MVSDLNLFYGGGSKIFAKSQTNGFGIGTVSGIRRSMPIAYKMFNLDHLLDKENKISESSDRGIYLVETIKNSSRCELKYLMIHYDASKGSILKDSQYSLDFLLSDGSGLKSISLHDLDISISRFTLGQKCRRIGDVTLTPEFLTLSVLDLVVKK